MEGEEWLLAWLLLLLLAFSGVDVPNARRAATGGAAGVQDVEQMQGAESS